MSTFAPLLCPAQESNDFDKMVPWIMHTIDNSSLGSDGSKLADVDGDGKQDVVVGWEEGAVARLYFQPEDPGDPWPFVEVKAPDVEDAFAVDLDGDGFQDLITLSEGKYQRIQVHWSPKDSSLLYQSEAWESADIPATVGKTKWMFGRAMDVDGKNGVDLIAGSKDPNGTIGWLASPEDARDLSAWEYREISAAGWIMSIELVDMNHDGLTDMLITDRYGALRGLRWLENPGPEFAENQWQNHFIGLQHGEPMFMGIHGYHHEKPPSIVVPDLVNGWVHFTAEGGKWQEEQMAFPPGTGSRGKSAVVADIDQDGRLDLLASFEGALGKSGLIAVLDFKATTQRVLNISGPEGVKYDFLTLLDMDQDGDLDILTSEETAGDGSKRGLGVIWYENPLK
ncbi:FG-GAP repeat domain-containing protein [Cyclobacterium lianum]|nr:VCBS repeat-containing protein [Cyclobacterium lianum]